MGKGRSPSRAGQAFQREKGRGDTTTQKQLRVLDRPGEGAKPYHSNLDKFGICSHFGFN